MWVTVSKEGYDPSIFYPVFQLTNWLNSTHLTYDEAGKKPLHYWKDKKVLFHFIWANIYAPIWYPFYKNIIEHAAITWIEFDADQAINDLYTIDQGNLQERFFLQKVFDLNPYVIWELPYYYQPYIGTLYRLKLRAYEDRFEKPINENKEIDFLGLVSDDKKNTIFTLHLLGRLKDDGYNVVCLVLDENIYNYYKDRWVPLIFNGPRHDIKSINRFNTYLNNSKVLINLSRRLTMGRILYDALFHGTMAICSQTYGSSEILFPDFAINTLISDWNSAYLKSKELIQNWSVDYVTKYREQIKKRASIEPFIKDLNLLTDNILTNGTIQKYTFK